MSRSGTVPNTSLVLTDDEKKFIDKFYGGGKSAAIHKGLEILMNTLEQITRETDNGTEWLINYDFENPDTLAMYLRSAAPAGSYKIDGYNIWATPEAVALAEQALEQDVAEQQ